MTLDGVEEAAAFTVPDSHGSQLIEAAVTAKPGFALTGDTAINHVASRLPAYAVPARVRVIDAFPRTSTGKINRREIEAAAATPSALTIS